MSPQELKAARKQLGLTQAELARELDMVREQVVRMERGQRGIDRRTELAMKYLLLVRERASAIGRG